MRVLNWVPRDLAIVLVAGTLAVACRAPAEEPTSACEPGFEPRAGACVACPAWTLPKDGGGCGCDEGFEYHAAKGTCEPVLPSSKCPPDSMPVLGKRECQPVGVGASSGCAEGFVSDGRGGCDALLPKAPCPAGKIAVPGDTACREVAACGGGTWGDIPDEPGAVYVDKSYPGGSSDGSRSRPFNKIQDAIGRAKADAIVAVAEGQYAENVSIAKPIRLWGRCPSKVELRGAGSTTLTLGISGIHVRGIAIVGPGVGISVSGEAVLEEIWLHDVDSVGVAVLRDASATIENSLIEAATSNGIMANAAKVTVSRSVVRNIRASATSSWGIGIYVGMVSKRPADLSLVGSVLEANIGESLTIKGSTAAVTASVIRATRAVDGRGGRGIYVGEDDAMTTAGSLRMLQSIVSDCSEAAIGVIGANASIEATVIRDTSPAPGTGLFGAGVLAQDTPRARSVVTVSSSAFERNHAASLDASGSSLTVTSTVVRGTKPGKIAAGASLAFGVAVFDSRETKQRGKLSLQQSLIEGNEMCGVSVFGSDATIVDSAIVDTVAGAAPFAVGVLVQPGIATRAPPKLDVSRTVIEKSQGAGMVWLGASGALRASLVRGTLPTPTGVLGRAIDVGEGSSVQFEGTLFEDNHEFGLALRESAARLLRVSIRKTVARASDGSFGDGVAAVGDGGAASLSVLSSRISESARVGVAAFGDAEVSIASSRLACNAIDVAKVPQSATDPRIDTSGGNNACGCDTAGSCVVAARDAKEIPPPVPLSAK